MAVSWYNTGTDEALQALGSSRSGLTGAEAGDRLLRYGPNRLTGQKKTPPVLVFLQQFLSPLIYVLFVAAVISLVLGHFLDAGVVLGVLLLNAIIGFVQEQQAEKAMEALIQMA